MAATANHSPHWFGKAARFCYRSRMTVTNLDVATRQSIDLFLARIGPRYPVAEAWLYGSRARGDARDDSDVDLAIVLPDSTRSKSDIALEFAADEWEVLTQTGRLVSGWPIWASEWRDPTKHRNEFFVRNIQREGIAV